MPRVAAVPTSPTIRFFLRDGQTNLGSFSTTVLEFDTRSNEYFITANNLRSLAIAGSSDANLKATINRYLQWRKERNDVPESSPLLITVTAEIDVNSRPIPIHGSFTVVLENLSK